MNWKMELVYLKVFLFGKDKTKYFKEEYGRTYKTTIEFPGCYVGKIPYTYHKYTALNEVGKQLLDLRFHHCNRVTSLTENGWVLSEEN